MQGNIPKGVVSEFKTLGSLLNCGSYTTREPGDVSVETSPGCRWVC